MNFPMMNFLAILLLFAPLASSLVSISFRGIFGGKKSFISSSIIIGFSLLYASIILYYVYNYGSLEVNLGDWFDVDSVAINWGIYIDFMSATMVFIVCLVSWCVHIYSFEYMSGSHFNQRFFCYLSLFTFFMLLLLVSGNIVQMFVGWEGVGLCSYLLISYNTKKNSATIAGMKAFIVNRVSDVFFCLGIFTYYHNYGTFDFFFGNQELIGIIDNYYRIFNYDIQACEVVSMLLFIGAMGKSAQLFFHVWLPDAMEGPTPVSALIHAATMVTAGVIVVAKLSQIFFNSPISSMVVTIVGISTSLIAGLIALNQDDIKKIIAYSTCSQLGYMFVLNGLGGYNFAIFHLFTHASFKALLFLSAGAIIHTLHHEQNIFEIRKIGVKSLLIKISMLIGCLAIAGIPPFAGFYSKDAMLEYVYAKYLFTNDLWILTCYVAMVCIACLTTLYNFRMFFVIFGSSKGGGHHHNEEVGKPISFALIVLSVCSVVFGIIGSNLMNIDKLPIDGNKLLFHFDNDEIFQNMHHLDIKIKFLPTLLSLFFILISYFIYKRQSSSGKNSFNSLFRNKLYFDEIYDIIFVKSYRYICSSVNSIIEFSINSAVFIVADTLSIISKKAKILIYENLSFYLFLIIFSIIIVCLLL